MRGGFTGSFWVTGEVAPKLYYTAALGNNLSTLGINASKLTRDLTKSVSLWWMPTTGEFGPRGGIGDFEHHEKAATRFGASYCFSREDRFNNIGQPSPDNTQVLVEPVLHVAIHQRLLSSKDGPDCSHISELWTTKPSGEPDHNTMPVKIIATC